ncbi:uncharacterized protein LOC110939324 [Helianthus annuus]|uniref:uncharacterized protein LOC110939324 n=1 Tax=Helianthus annuus TaxID=4232 RepID=UPI000B902866|nr:uncharacterized protein LOC110939324 [Helianthus annuus]
MDGRGGGCIARYSGSNSRYGEITYGMSKVERIMLKFTPIAPKPMAAGSGSSCSTVEHSDGSGRTPRRKRSGVHGGDTVVTLALMPETPERKENSPATSSPSEKQDVLFSGTTVNNKKPSQVLLSFNSMQSTARDGHVIASPKPQKLMVTSLVTVECVTATWMNGDGVGLTDQARILSMEMDTCPSFITNSRDTVVWTNKAYREMITGSDNYSDEMVMVVVKKFNRVTLPVCHPAFTCTVKVTWGADRATAVTAPCDVWRLCNGGYAWRLDVKAALSLGRYS